MLTEFMRGHSDEIVARCRDRIAARNPGSARGEIQRGIPSFLHRLESALDAELGHGPQLSTTSIQHGAEVRERGFTVAQLVHDYGDACQAITEVAMEQGFAISTEEFRALNRCLDNSIADAVTEYQNEREREVVAGDTVRLGHQLGGFAHELRGAIGTAMLAFDMLRTGNVGIMGSTGSVLARSLTTLRDLADRSLTELQLAAGVERREQVPVAQFVEEVEIVALVSARSRGLELTVDEVAPDLTLEADRQILASVVANVLQNAFERSRPRGHVWLRTRETPSRVMFDIEDECDGAAVKPGGFGPELAICERGVHALHGEMHVEHRPGQGCVLTIDLPRGAAPAVA